MSNNKTKPGLLARLFGQKSLPEEPPTREGIQSWLINRLATHLQISPEEIDIRETLSNYGLDSRTAVSLSGELERWLRRPLPPTLAWDYPTIAEMVNFLAQEAGESAPNAAPSNGQV